LTRFTGIFFGDFYTGGDKDILGALAVEGNLHAPNYAVNVDHVRRFDCFFYIHRDAEIIKFRALIVLMWILLILMG